ncbi:MAG TPA: hypothetical protein VH089_11375 [Streptosporangiaceae bacterium]|nr:hypothetical protein [Streptosporangiaceae bacterium]
MTSRLAVVITIGPAGRSWPTIDVAPVPDAKTIKNRLHLDLRADGTSTTAGLEVGGPAR